MPKRKCVFTEKLQNEFKFLKLCAGSNDRVKCQTCKAEFSVEHRGRCDVEAHLKTDRHKKAQNSASAHSIASFFKNADPTNADLQCAAKEATFAYHTAQHGLSFKTSDCTSKLVKTFFEPKFTGARTKTEAIIINVIAPYILKTVLKSLEEANFVTVTIDCSNRNEIKLTPICVRYFTLNEGVSVKMLYFDELPGETSDILNEYLLKCITKYGIDGKVVCLCADNTNTNFGGVNRKGQGNVFRKLQKSLCRPIFGIGCSAHILHNTVQHACDSLPIDVEVIVVKVYKYFYQYTVRVTALKEFCDFVNIEYKRVMAHANTRFLSLLPAIERILFLFEALKLYFLDNQSTPVLVLEFFLNPVSEIYFKFVHGSLHMFQISILKLESDHITAPEAAQVYAELVVKLEGRKADSYIPFAAKQLLSKLGKENILNSDDEAQIRQSIGQFYQTAVDYLKNWESSFDGAIKFKWLTLNEEIRWDEMEESATIINNIVPNSVNLDELFDERSSLIYALKQLKPKWDALPDDQKPNSQGKWKEIFDAFTGSHVSFMNIFKLVEFAMCLPGTSAPAERIFSMMGSIWTAERGRLSVPVVKGLLTIKANSDLTCLQFHEKVRKDNSFLKQIMSSEKYGKSEEEAGPSNE